MCGIKINMAEKMSEFMNTHVKCENKINMIYLCQSHEYTLTHLIKQGVMEADKNGFENFRPTLYNITIIINKIHGHGILYRLLEVNKPRVLSVTVQYNYAFKNEQCSIALSVVDKLKMSYNTKTRNRSLL